MENIIGLKELRQKMSKYAQKVKEGYSFIVVKQSNPIFKITPLNEECDNWETVADFTKIKKGGIEIKDILSRL